MLYRLYRRDPVSKGKWYYTVACHGCGKPIPILDDQSAGQLPAQLSGQGKLLIPCLDCAYDDEYSLTELTSLQYEEDMPGARPPRVEISKSSRKPLWKVYPKAKAKAILGIGLIEDRPNAAVIVSRIVTSWSDIEVQCARLLAEIMGTNVAAAAAVFGSLRSSRAQHDALAAAAEVVLDANDLELFAAYMARRASLEKERNDLAHGCFGVSVSIPDHIVWVSQSDYTTFSANQNVSDADIEQFRKKQYVYELGTLERIAQEISEFYSQLGFFSGYLGARRNGINGSFFRTQRYPQLCSQPHIRQALDRLRTLKKSEQTPP
jgi:hypothetical protein